MHLSFEGDLRIFAHQPDIYRLYIETYADQGVRGQNKRLEYLPDNYDANRQSYQVVLSVFDLLARLLGKKLRIVHKIDDTTFALKHEDSFDGEPVTVLHTVYGRVGGYAFSDILKNIDPDDPQRGPTEYDHYNLLLSNDEYVDFLKTVDPMSRSGIKPGEVYLYSEGDAHDIGLKVTAQNKVYMGARGTYAQSEVHDWWEQQVIKKKRRFNPLNGFNKTKRLRSKQAWQAPRPCTIESKAKKDIHVSGGKDLMLRGSVLKGGKLTVEAKNGLIHLLTTMGMTLTEVKKSSKDPLWQSKSQSFAYHEDRQQCQFFYDEEEGGIEFKTPEGIVVELVTEKHSHADGKENKCRPQEWQRLKDFSQTPGYEWMKLLDQREDVVRIYVDERHDSGRFAQQGMSAAARVVAFLIAPLSTIISSKSR